jgi:C4-dicarboxylate transporter, DctM subunit
MSGTVIGLLGLTSMFVLALLHVPLGASMAIAGLVGFSLMAGFAPAASIFATETASVVSNVDLVVIPMFILMGAFASVGGLARDMYDLAYAVLGHRRGGLAMATIGGSAGFGAVCGSAIATTATFGRAALPEMEARGYSRALSAGSVAAGGTLGILIPPSTIMVIYAVITEQFVVDLFVAAIVPGLLAVAMYLLAVQWTVLRRPADGPVGPQMSWPERFDALRRGWGVVLLAVVVLGGIYSGVFTVNEAAAIGVLVALFMARLRGALNLKSFLGILRESSATTAMLYMMLIGASVFSYFLAATHLPADVVRALGAVEIDPLWIVFGLLIFYIVLGAFFDEVAAMILTMPFVFPLITNLGFDPVWWGIVNVMVIEIGLICPPIGLNVLVLHGLRPDVSLATIYRGVTPFLVADITRLSLIVFFPAIVLWLPHALK